MAEKRIIELTNEKLSLSDGDYTIVDSENGTYKYKLKRIQDAIPAIDSTLTQTGKAADAKAVGDAIASVDVDTVNNARQLLSESYVLDEEPYLFRASGGDGADRVEECIVGGTVGWNQLVSVQRNDKSKTENGVTGTDNRDGTYTIQTTEQGATADVYLPVAIPVQKDHKYYFRGTPSGGSTDTYQSYIAGSGVIEYKADIGGGSIVNGLSSANASFVIWRVRLGTIISTPITFNPQLFDITTLFGPTIADYIYSLEQSTEGAGVAWFRKYFPEDYYEYSAPTLKHVEGVSAKQVVGFNQWDEEWEVGGIDASTGQNTSDSSSLRCKNYIHVVPSTSYYVTGLTGGNLRPIYYDADKNYISAGYWQGGTSNNPQTTPSNCHYMRFYLASTYGTTYNHDICISLSDPTKNGTYEPYHKNIYPLDSTLTLRGIFKLDANNKLYADGDLYSADGVIGRNYIEKTINNKSTLGSFAVGDNTCRAYVSLSDIAPNNTTSVHIISDRETFVPDYIVNNDVEGISENKNAVSNGIWLRVAKSKLSENTIDGLKEYLSSHPITVVCQLKTPTTETATPYTSIQTLDPHGTEEFVSTGIVPVGHESHYLENLRSKIEGLPKDFSTLIAPTEAAYKATRNYTTGDLLIVDNTLYKATANIANGGTITPNTNVTATTLAAVIAALA